MGHILKILLFLLFMSSVKAFSVENVATENIIVLKERGNSQTSGLFGHSIALGKKGTQYQRGKYYAYVGDPIDDTHGNVYKCEIDLQKRNQDCSIVQGNYSLQI